MATLSQLGVPYLLDDESEQAAAPPARDDAAQPGVDGELHALLRRAAANATGGAPADADVDRYVAILNDEWIADVEALRRLEPGALDELLPLLLSQELQRLAREGEERKQGQHEHAQGFNRHGHWRRNTHRMAPEAPHGFINNRGMETIPEAVALGDEDVSSSSSSVGRYYEQTYASTPAVTPAKTAWHKKTAATDRKYVRSTIKYVQNKKSQAFCRLFDILDHFCSSNIKDDEPNDLLDLHLNNSNVEDEGVDDDELQKMSNSAPFTANRNERAYHLVADASRKADIVENTREKFPTREALEDAIVECEARVQREKEAAATGAVGDNPDADAKGSPVLSAEDELRFLYPLRLVLPTSADLAEMISALQDRRMKAMRDLDKRAVQGLGREIDQLQRQMDAEERHCRQRQWRERDCAACGERFVPPTETKGAGAAAYAREVRCEKCREVFGSEREVPSVVRRVFTDVMRSAPSTRSEKRKA